MSSIYENACLNISALAAAETATSHFETGLFVTQTDYAKDHSPVCAWTQCKGYDEIWHFFRPEETVEERVLVEERIVKALGLGTEFSTTEAFELVGEEVE
jgi:hypothetical protein